MSDKTIIEYCSPTLAGLKTGSLFSTVFTDRAEMIRELKRLNRIFKPKGLCAVPFRTKAGRYLVYIFRPARLREDLKSPEAYEILAECGYPAENAAYCLRRLASRLLDQGTFPHEIGLFLGYPPSDVRSFMKDPKSGVQCTGCWKAYGNREEAEKTFSRFDKCTDVYTRCFAKGRSLERLAVRTKNAVPDVRTQDYSA